MDAIITKETGTYKLVNRVNGNIEMSGLGRVKAYQEQNTLWARGIKTDVKEEQ